MNSTALLAGFITTGVTLLVSVVLFAIERIVSWRRMRDDRRKAVADRVLEVVHESIRTYTSHVLLRRTNPKVELLLMAHRLGTELRPKERALQYWLVRETQDVMLAPNRTEATKIAVQIADALVAWRQREKSLEWFGQELQNRPVVQNFRVPRSVRVRQLGEDAKEGIVTGVEATLLLAAAKWMFKS